MKPSFLILLGTSICMPGFAAQAQTESTGTLIVDIAEFSSELKLKPKIEKRLKTGGLEWGVKDGLVVVTMVNKRFVNFDMPQFTRYATKANVTVPAGEYRITGIGFTPKTAFSAEKMLEKGAFFNENVMTFRVEPGKTSTIAIRPVIQKNETFFLKFFQPALLTSVITDSGKSDEVSIVAQTEKSVAWPAYSGPLKFTAK